MHVCDFCGKELSSRASFCGFCGRTSPGHSPEALTSRGELLTAVEEEDVEARPTVITPSWEWDEAVPGNTNQAYDDQLSPGVEEEERQRSAALLDMGLLGFGGEEQFPTAMVQGTPQLNGVPFVQGTPQRPGGNFAPGGYSAQALYSTPTLQIPAPQYAPPSAALRPTSPLRQPHLPQRPPRLHRPGGCAPTWLILLFAAIIIITSIISISLTVLSPSLTLIGSTDLSLGDSLRLHGSGFVPVSAVILTLDDTTPLYFTDASSSRATQASPPTRAMQASPPLPTTAPAPTVLMNLGIAGLHEGQTLSANSIVKVGIDGTFNVTIHIDQSWHTGQHTIRAAERIFPRSAVILITVNQPGESPTSSPSDTATPSGTPSPSVTASPSATASGLSCVNPNSVTLGPVSENNNQAISTQVSLCTGGSGTVNWVANWDQTQAPWLRLDHSTGQIQAPGQQAINVSALATTLKAGTYSATVIFSSQQSSTTETLNITFIVQAGCIHTSQEQLSFTGVEKVSDPQAQKLTFSNCGIVGSWSTSISTDNNTHWLSVTPAGGALNSGAAQSVTVTASNLKTQLGAGTYSGKITLSIGSNQVIVNVTLTVAPAPKIILNSPSSGIFVANKDCTPGQNGSPGGWTCIASISNSSSTSSLSWRSSSTGVSNITFTPSSDTLPANGTERVVIFVPANNCQTSTTLTFVGPANVVTISWSCAIIL